MQRGGVQHPLTAPLGSALKIPPALSLGREEMLLLSGLAYQRVLVPDGGKREDLRTRGRRKPLDIILLASCVCQTTVVIYSRKHLRKRS